MTMKLKRVVISYEVLMPVTDEVGDLDTSDVLDKCAGDEWSGMTLGSQEEILEGKEACQAACDKQDTDLEFFFPDGDEEVGG